tara:strand:+ start:3519 stop:4247 length:729 start_codon:yes stop_codon:yes gene_type:complete
MSNPKNAIQEIKSLLVKFGFMADENSLLSFKLEDKTILETEKLEKGASIYKINEAFERVALEDGVYKLKEHFEIEVSEGQITSVKEIFVDAKLVDGTQIKVEGEALAEGAKVVVVTEEGEVPAPDGVHEIEDGTKVETKDGVIVKVEEVVAEMPEAEVEVEVPMQGGADMQLVDLVKEFVAKMGEKIKAMETEMSSLNAEFKSFKKEPAAKKIADGKTDFNKQANDDIEDKISTIMSLRNKK